MSRTAVVILNYNGERLLQQFLSSVITHSREAEIIVADNGSTDGSIALLEKEFPSIRIIRLDSNYGFCGGYNRALQLVDADYYVLLNSDIEVTPGWLTPLINLLDTKPDVAAVHPKILSYHHKHQFEYAGAGGGLIDALGYPFCRGRIFDYVEEDQGQYNDQRQVFWATGACLMIRAKAYHQFNGLDEDFFAHMEEIDLCWKLQRAGQWVHYCGYSTIYHVGAGTLGYDNPRKTYLNFRNGLFLIFKHFDDKELLYKLPLRIALDWLAAVMYLVTGKASNAIAVLKAHRDFIFNLGREVKKRKALQCQYPEYSRAAIYQGSVIIDFFLLKKRKIGQ
ncbi:MAG TPA: glycosyltransferase family 2 protein [Ohtaekwangia sp.]|uniref:glycosyltransferase family 2 protein n=1 Tax=Ohtaekwangia sp. TaxID=2066019 RepID=UPI002F94E54A